MTAVELAALVHAERCHAGWVRELTVFGTVRVPCVLCDAGRAIAAAKSTSTLKLHIHE